MARIVTIIGTRPEIIKMGPVVKALDALPHEHILVHSGQHYDLMMDRVFFKDMALREPDFRLELKEQPPHLQVARTAIQAASVAAKADLVIVHGDTNTTLAGALLGSKLGKPVAHVEAGIRSFDKTMPEEVNRILTDQVSRILFAPTETARRNLAAENVREGVHVVGNSVIDALVQNTEAATKTSKVLKRLRLDPARYAILTFHRAENVDDPDRLKRVLQAVSAVASRHGLTIVFPIHPRTEKKANQFGLNPLLKAPGMKVVPPTGYLDMLELEHNAALVLTDSGGLQEEACYFHVPCVTLRESTERPETLQIGANVLAGTDPSRILDAAATQLAAKREWPNPYGDGTTGERIAGIVSGFFG
jgi:UDP-N-acetylglucosamine 2-epimerase (non-hydrolysing)